MENPDIIKAITPVVEALEKLSITYHIGGSIASSLYGIARATIDADIAADIKKEHILPLKSFLDTQYYFDEEMIGDAIQRKSSFNLIHLKTMIKIDIFIHKNEPYHYEALKRRRKDTIIAEGKTSDEYYFSSPEDVILNKLQWYEMGERVSERQWLDVLGIIKVQGSSLDKEYLIHWADKLDLIEILKKAYENSGIGQ